MKIMEQCTLVFMVLMLCLSITGTLYGQDQEYIEHSVTAGETLWGIASKEIADPFLWPKIWKENPDIANPDLIYPSQRIKIPLYLLQKEAVPVQKSAETAVPEPVAKTQVGVENKATRNGGGQLPEMTAPVVREYLVDRPTLIASGYIADAITSKGDITGAPSEKDVLGQYDHAYIHTTDPVVNGKKFYIIRPSGKVKHPETGALLGYLIWVVGVAEVIGTESGQTEVRINESYSDVDIGDLLDDYIEMEQPYLTGEPGFPAIKGFIVAAKMNWEINAQKSIVYIDKGRRDGIEIGDVVGMLSRNPYDVPNGVVQIISMKETTATAIIRESRREVSPGDKIVPLR